MVTPYISPLRNCNYWPSGGRNFPNFIEVLNAIIQHTPAHLYDSLQGTSEIYKYVPISPHLTFVEVNTLK
jgi:hypothetical protein